MRKRSLASGAAVAAVVALGALPAAAAAPVAAATSPPLCGTSPLTASPRGPEGGAGHGRAAAVTSQEPPGLWPPVRQA